MMELHAMAADDDLPIAYALMTDADWITISTKLGAKKLEKGIKLPLDNGKFNAFFEILTPRCREQLQYLLDDATQYTEHNDVEVVLKAVKFSG